MRRLVLLLPLLLCGCGLGAAGIPLYIAVLSFSGIVITDATQIFLRVDLPPPAVPKP